MNFQCNCTSSGGCFICDTKTYIAGLPTPEECANELVGEAHFTHDQAGYIASGVYQPLLEMIAVPNNKIDQLSKGES